MDRESFWHIRAEKYDKLFWTRDKSYIDTIIKAGKFSKKNLVLDVGTGTGVMARAIKHRVKHVIGLDISDSMLKKRSWEGVSLIKWDAAESLFRYNLFDKIIARMVFHHILNNLDRVFLRCHDLLKEKGRLIVAEGVPPTEDKEVIDWYTYMFSFKEKRRTFTPSELFLFFKRNGFKNIKTTVHVMKKFSIKNWLANSGLKKKLQKKILNLHLNAPQKVKDAYNMRIAGGNCFVDTKNLVVVGEK